VNTISFEKAVDILENAEEIMCEDDRVLFKQWSAEMMEEMGEHEGSYNMEWVKDDIRKFTAKDNKDVHVTVVGAYHALRLYDSRGYMCVFRPLQGIVIKEAL
jgi:hypothetical protein